MAAALLGAWLGASVWVSLGAVALTEVEHRTRVGALPSPWVLAALMAAGALAAVVGRPSRGRSWPLLLAALLWLPWLPLRVPAAFLVWDGPFEALVWMAIALGLIADVRIRVARHAARLGDPRVAPVVAAGVAAVCWLATAAAVSDRVPAGDEPHYLIITQSLLLDGDLRIENNHTADDYLAYYGANLRRPDFMRRGRDGQIYSVHLPGLPALLLPAFAVAGYPGALVCIVLLSAVASAFAWHAAWLLTRNAAAAWIAWAGVSLSAPVLFHAFTIYPDPVGAAIAMFVVWLVARLELGEDMARPAWLVAAGTALACLPWLHSRFSIVAAGLGAAIVLRLIRRPTPLRLGSAFLIVPAGASLAWFGYFWLVYGSPDPSLPYNGLGQNRIATIAPGLPGLLFDQQFGLVATAPVFAVTLLGWLPFLRRAPRLAIELTLIAIVYVLAVASYGMWWGGQSAPARFLLILLWPSVLPIAWIWHRARSAVTRASIAISIALGTAAVIARATVQDGALLYNSRDGYDLLLDRASPSVSLPLAFPSFHRDAVPAALMDVALWTVCGAAAFVLLAWMAGGRGRRGAVWTWTAGATAAWFMAASTLVWARHGEAAFTPSSSKAAFLDEWNPHRQSFTFAVRPFRALGTMDVLSRMELTTATRAGQGSGHRPLLEIPRVPAGQYSLLVRGPASRTGGRLSVMVGRTGQPLDSVGPDLSDVVWRVPIEARSVSVDADPDTRSRITSVSLRPQAITAPSERVSSAYAHRAAVYGGARVFFLDDNAFAEGSGFWTRGAARTTLLIEARPAPSLAVTIRNGGAANRVSLRSAGRAEWRDDLQLAPGEIREIAVPRQEEGPLFELQIDTEAGFRPAQLDRTNLDLRDLGVWVELRESGDRGHR